MSNIRHKHPIPGESAKYRAARDKLFQAELDLIEQVESVAGVLICIQYCPSFCTSELTLHDAARSNTVKQLDR